MSDVVEDNPVGETGDIEEITDKLPNVDIGIDHDSEPVSTSKEDHVEKEAPAVAEHAEAANADNIESEPKQKSNKRSTILRRRRPMNRTKRRMISELSTPKVGKTFSVADVFANGSLSKEIRRIIRQRDSKSKFISKVIHLYK